ncbi:tRNA-uridine aminocarboxypropyltransferase [Vibrio salinus]|uniref:tRNA-uridine aminocarboxypropyltransferase n=1 Tax=Vibrio salinus TaxID=2899784 RepID=UPI001E39E19E|nr:tRNA-uridine aminocarboxypropyltransferase [Vibrio salinus]MCE0492520.1 DTW domain-containing protein [Vibrio salinus]
MRIHQFHTVYQARVDKATKPFTARGSKVKRCPYCQIEEHLCLCRYQPDIECTAKFILLVSDTEIFKPSNTGRLIADTIKETDVYLWSRTNPDTYLLKTLSDPNLFPIVIFPEEYVDDKKRLIVNLKDDIIHTEKKPLFIVLDGSWREARRMFRRSPYLDSLPVMSVHPEHLSEYIMRKSGNAKHLSTAEVSSLVLQQAGYENTSKILEYWFRAFRESYLLSKSRTKKNLQRPALNDYLALKSMYA